MHAQGGQTAEELQTALAQLPELLTYSFNLGALPAAGLGLSAALCCEYPRAASAEGICALSTSGLAQSQHCVRPSIVAFTLGAEVHLLKRRDVDPSVLTTLAVC